MKNLLPLCLSAIMLLNTPAAVAEAMSNVAINGQRLSQSELMALQMQLGIAIAPGSYMVDANGCWLNLSTGAMGCGSTVITNSRHGSGERTSDGSWNHYSRSADMGVGGTADGCIYTTTGWSNC